MSWKKIVAGVAPTIATALGGPLAGTATKFIAGALLGDENADEAEVEAAILDASPEDLAKLKQIDNDFKIKMKELDIDLERMGYEDRSSARELAKTNMWPQIVLSVVFIGGYFGILWILFDEGLAVHESMRDMAGVLLGVLTAGIPMILKFWFGGSPQDSDHLERIYRSVPKD